MVLLAVNKVKLLKPLLGQSPSGDVIVFPRGFNILVAPNATYPNEISEDDWKDAKDIAIEYHDLETKLGG